MEYTILRTKLNEISYDSKEWEKANVAKIGTVNWDVTTYCPDTEVRVLTNDEGLFVRFETDEENLRFNAEPIQGKVHLDSCVEFFFIPDPKNSKKYFNFEFNAKGAIHLGYGEGRSPIRTPCEITDVSIFKIESFIKGEKGFILKFFIPYSYILKYADGIGDYFLGNFYKCREEGEKPHFVSLNPIKTPEPDFHRPEFFDKIYIELDK